MKKLILVSVLFVAACSSGSPAPSGPTPQVPTQAPDSFLVTFTTTKGNFVAKAHRDWSPMAVDRFFALVQGNVWKDARIFRVVPGFVAQWGLTGDSAKDNFWRRQRVPDEPVKVPNTRGRISFARGGPESRTLQVFVNLTSNRMLDDMVAGGVAGYPPIAEVIDGMDVVDKFESKYGESPTAKQGEMSTLGWSWLDAQFPGLDRIIGTRVTRQWK